MGTAIQLMRNDGTLLARNLPIADAIGQRYPALAVAPTSAAMPGLVNPLDGRRVFLAVTQVRNSQLKLAVTRDAAQCAAAVAR